MGEQQNQDSHWANQQEQEHKSWDEKWAEHIEASKELNQLRQEIKDERS